MRPGHEAALACLSRKDPFAILEFDSEEPWPIDGEDEVLEPALGPWTAGRGDMAASCESSKVVG